MNLLDTNIIIYSGQKAFAHLRPLISNATNFASDISKVEALGYNQILENEKQYLIGVFALLTAIPITSAVIEKAIELRQLKKLTLGDSLIASTALVHQLTLFTANTKDFKGIHGLKIYNPITT